MCMATPKQAKRVYDISKHISSQARKYVYGGGHGVPLSDIDPGDGLDCSSSVCLVLKRCGMWRGRYAGVSGSFKNWGQPGRGRYFTVWYNERHVWIEFHGGTDVFGQYKRFDTSPWGWGGRGPRVRKLGRPRYGFQARHWPGL